ncbi:hypothetical protein PCANC_27213 [Puccinia coronata f. sp. avenae]|uniref:Uncharacterized protein n=1 Tax=Puccinia coronata f. sp. avenae TaxID=200324 RepID=A0A2N5RVM0_9BASI|nr:hypothetical protein PCANC_27213 [Puccinia coronata f. sp. avenae]
MTTDQRSAPSGSGTIQNSNHYLGHQSISLQAAWTNLVQTNWNRELLAEVNPLLTPTNTITSSSSMTDQMINAIELWCRQAGTAFIVWLPHPTEESTIFHCSRHLIIDRIHHNPPLPTLLYPTITTKGFTTKLYHINGKGKDAGVVYSARMRAWCIARCRTERTARWTSRRIRTSSSKPLYLPNRFGYLASG